MNITTDKELEFELQELYILCKHWLDDILFIEDELRFFKNVLKKYQDMGSQFALPSKGQEFSQKIQQLEQHIVSLKVRIPEYLNFLKPFIGDLKKEMDLDLVEKYNALETEIKDMFASII